MFKKIFYFPVWSYGGKKRSLIYLIESAYRKFTLRNLKILINLFLKPFYYIYFSIKHKEYPPKVEVFYINPKKIYGCMTHNIWDEVPFFEGDIKGGEWDIMLMKKRLQNPKYLGLVDRFVHKKPWIQTRLFTDWYLQDLNNGKRAKGFKDIESLIKHHELKYDNLFDNIKKNGLDPSYPLPVIINHDGEFIWTYDGNHRLYMAMILNIDQIPVKVIRRHKKFQSIKDMLANAKDDKLYQKFKNHPDIIIDK